MKKLQKMKLKNKKKKIRKKKKKLLLNIIILELIENLFMKKMIIIKLIHWVKVLKKKLKVFYGLVA